MITPDDQVPLDDSENSDAEDQQSQQDIHSNGIEDFIANTAEPDANPDALKQAYDASEAAYTLKLDDIKPEKKKE